MSTKKLSFKKCRDLITAIYKAKSDSVSWTFLERAIHAENDSYMLKLFLYALYKLHYTEHGSLCTDYIEIKINNTESVPNNPEDKCRKAFNDFYEAKQLKAGAMCGLIEEYDSSAGMKELIRQYSTYTSDHLSHFPLIARNANRQSARQNLATTVQRELNDEQRKIYNASINENINVQAGAGSGKTRLLTYRALRLILAENNPERKILILAYNRAVRDEVDKRMREYAGKIGYTLRDLQIYTFHGYAAKCLPELSENRTPMEQWEKRLLNDITTKCKCYSNKYQYILIDEFQDVTETRLQIILELLKLNQGARAFVIGDMFQSIYGYEKRKDRNGQGEQPSIEPIDYYNRLEKFTQHSLK